MLHKDRLDEGPMKSADDYVDSADNISSIHGDIRRVAGDHHRLLCPVLNRIQLTSSWRLFALLQPLQPMQDADASMMLEYARVV